MRGDDGPVKRTPASIFEQEVHARAVSPGNANSTAFAGSSAEILKDSPDIDTAAADNTAPLGSIAQIKQPVVPEEMGKALEGETRHGPGRA